MAYVQPSTQATSNAAGRRGSAQPIDRPEVAAAGLVAVVAPPRRPPERTPSSSRLGHGTRAHATRLARIYATGSSIMPGMRWHGASHYVPARARLAAGAMLCLVALAGCEATQSRAVQGATIGSAVGAATGAVVGHRYGETGVGTSVGAGLGGVAGGLTGAAIDARQKSQPATPAEASAQKFCPIGGEWYPEAMKYCPLHGVELRKRTAEPATP
ncbi:MAG: hypothetical protein HY352_00300 [Candidatus Omnitrophica bacterium]|nr:hypothetical protein [Candidatus Omnitrophota bacterium]